MPCFHPLQGYRARGGGVSFGGRSAYVDLPLVLPCGRCIGCRLEHSRQWAVRCMHEASLHEENSFVTLTYADAPVGLIKRDHQTFLKRLRRKLRRKISFYLCGEYGETFARPHFHAIIFGWWPEDAVPWKKTGQGQLYTSALLESVWGHGFCSVGPVTFETAAYVSRYVTKKVTGDRADGHYTWLDPDTGELVPVESEYAAMSTRPAIGRKWVERFGDTDAFRRDRVVSRGREVPLPRFYDKVLAEIDEARALKVKRKRMSAPRNSADSTPERLAVREVVTVAKLATKKRTVK